MATVKPAAKERRRKRRQYGTGSVYERADGIWVGTIEAGWTPTGKRRRITVSGKTEKLAKDRLKSKRDEIASGGASTLSGRTTVKSYAEQWLAARAKRVRPNTYTTNAAAVRRWIIPTIGQRRLGDLTSGDIRRFQDAMRDAGVLSSTMNRHHSTLNKLLKDAVVDGATIHAGVLKVPKPTINETDRQDIPLPDAIKLLEVIGREADPSRWVAIILNGFRQGERLGLTWEHVDFDAELLHISWQLDELQYVDNRNKHLGFRVPDGYEARRLESRWHLVRPKTSTGLRVAPMTPWMKSSLLAWREIAPTSPHGLVWCRPDGGPIDPRDAMDEWRRLQDAAGIRHPERIREVAGKKVPDYYVAHEGRHTTVTMLKELGVEDEVIEQIVGQSKLLKSYVHHDLLPKSRAALNQLAERLALTA